MATSRGAGRRTGPSTSREEILAAARVLFAERGLDRTSVRAIAAAAGVDPALVMYFFGTKRGLFLEAIDLPVDPSVVIPAVLDGDPAGVGERLARFVVGVLEDPDRRQRFTGLLQSASADPEIAEILRTRLTRDILEPIATRLGRERPEFRAAMAMSQIAGLTMARHVVGLDVLREAAADDIVAALAPTLQRHLAGEPGGEPAGEPGGEPAGEPGGEPAAGPG
jgi:AcrR family transcriptional regulator